MSAVVEIQGAFSACVPLLADADLARPIAWRDGKPVAARDFLADVAALAAQLPSARHAVNLCDDRYRFIVAFCAAAVAGQTNLLPGNRTPQTIAETSAAYPDSYVLADRAQDGVDARQFVVPQALSRPAAATMPGLPPDRVVAIAFTSGSTGTPKANPKTWGAVCASSAFNADAVSVANAYGLMQIIAPTARDLDPKIEIVDLFKPSTNAKLGTKYIAQLLNRFRGSVIGALAAYNAGPGNSDRWYREFGSKFPPEEYIEQIGFRETREYVQNILRN